MSRISKICWLSILLIAVCLVAHLTLAFRAGNFLPLILLNESRPIDSHMPDTGIDFCKNMTARIDCPEAGSDFYGQDSQYNASVRKRSYSLYRNGTVIDNVTGLMWMQSDNNSIYTWHAAIEYCQNATLGGYTDWRLPDYHELSYLVDRSRYGKKMSIDPVFSGHALPYWTNSTFVGNPEAAWGVFFDGGYTYYYFKDYWYYVRCVRTRD